MNSEQSQSDVGVSLHPGPGSRDCARGSRWAGKFEQQRKKGARLGRYSESIRQFNTYTIGQIPMLDRAGHSPRGIHIDKDEWVVGVAHTHTLLKVNVCT